MSKFGIIFDKYMKSMSLQVKKYLLLVVSTLGGLSLLISLVVVTKNVTVQVMLFTMKGVLILPLISLISVAIFDLLLILFPSFTNKVLVQYPKLSSNIEKLYISAFYLFYLMVGIFIFSASIYLTNNFNFKDLMLLVIAALYLISILSIMSIGTVLLFAVLNTISSVGVHSVKVILVDPFINFFVGLKKSFIEVVDPEILFNDLRKYYLFMAIFAFLVIIFNWFENFKVFIGKYFIIGVTVYILLEIVFNIFLARKNTEYHQSKAKKIVWLICKNKKLTRLANFIVSALFIDYIFLSFIFWFYKMNHDAVQLIISQAFFLSMLAFGYSTANQALCKLALITHLNKLKIKN